MGAEEMRALDLPLRSSTTGRLKITNLNTPIRVSSRWLRSRTANNPSAVAHQVPSARLERQATTSSISLPTSILPLHHHSPRAPQPWPTRKRPPGAFRPLLTSPKHPRLPTSLFDPLSLCRPSRAVVSSRLTSRQRT